MGRERGSHAARQTEPLIGKVARRATAILTTVLVTILRAYKRCISPFLPRACRFYPSCSVYAADAVRTFGPFRGVWMAASRLCRCHPFHPGGYDPVPPPTNGGTGSQRG